MLYLKMAEFVIDCSVLYDISFFYIYKIVIRPLFLVDHEESQENVFQYDVWQRPTQYSV